MRISSATTSGQKQILVTAYDLHRNDFLSFEIPV